MRKINLIFIALAILMVSACAGADVRTTSSASGTAAPDFTLADQDGKLWKLSDALKDYRAVVLAFYGKDHMKL